MKRNSANKTSPEYLLQQIAGARSALLVVLIFTVVNLVMLLLDSGTYFLFSASVPYYLTAFGLGMDIGMGESGIGTFTLISLGISAVMLLLYLLSWLLSKKRSGWLVVALVAFVLDTVALVLVCLAFDAVTDSIVDFLFHGWVILQLAQGIIANRKIRKMIREFDPDTEESDAPVTPWDLPEV